MGSDEKAILTFSRLVPLPYQNIKIGFMHTKVEMCLPNPLRYFNVRNMVTARMFATMQLSVLAVVSSIKLRVVQNPENVLIA